MYVYFNTVTDNDANVFKNKNLYFIDKPYGYTNDRVEVLFLNTFASLSVTVLK